MQGIIVELLVSVVEVTLRFIDIALSSPPQFVLLGVGALLTFVTVLGFGYLALGGLLALGGGGLPTPGRGYRDMPEETGVPRAAPNPAHDSGATGAARAQDDPYDG